MKKKSRDGGGTMLALAFRHTNKLIRSTVKEEGVRLGRFFTPRKVAEQLRLRLPLPPKDEVAVLDAGAGTGILAVAAVEALLLAGYVKRITLTVYETDKRMLPTLTDILKRVRRRAHHDFGVKLVLSVREEDFLAGAVGLAEGRGEGERYDIVLLHPPTGVPQEGTPAAAFAHRVLPAGGDIAFLFAEAAAARLAEGGVMAAILPLAFADSVRVAPLRERLFARAPLYDLFFDGGGRGSRRDKTLVGIFRYDEEPTELTVSVADKNGYRTLSPIPYHEAVFSSEYKLLLAKSEEDVALAKAMAAFPARLADLGLCVHTGLTIETRYPECLRHERTEGAVALLHPAGLYDGQMHFPPPGREKPYLIPRIPSLSSPNRTMVLVKRVPTRRDGRHLVAGVYFSGQLPYDERISTANKLEVIEAIEGEMEADLALGLTAVLSCDYYERYCTLTGTFGSVTASALAALPLPPKEKLLAIGRVLSSARNYSRTAMNVVANRTLLSYFEQK